MTIRHGPRVERTEHASLPDAVEALRQEAEEIRSEGELARVRMLRTFEAADRVNARLELSCGGWLRRREAGIDVMGDGSLVPYRGGIARRRLHPGDSEDAADAVRSALEA